MNAREEKFAAARLAEKIARTKNRHSISAPQTAGRSIPAPQGGHRKTVAFLYKAEIIHRRGPWRSLEAVEFATLEWVDWFNNRRLLEPIANIPPAEAEERYYAMLEQPAMAA